MSDSLYPAWTMTLHLQVHCKPHGADCIHQRSWHLQLVTRFPAAASRTLYVPRSPPPEVFFLRNGLVLGYELRHTLHFSLVWRGSALITTSAGGPQHWMLGLFVLFSQPPSNKHKQMMWLWCWAPLGMIIRGNNYSCPGVLLFTFTFCFR